MYLKVLYKLPLSSSYQSEYTTLYCVSVFTKLTMVVIIADSNKCKEVSTRNIIYVTKFISPKTILTERYSSDIG